MIDDFTMLSYRIGLWPTDHDDNPEHARYAVYLHAITDLANAELAIAALSVEADPAMAGDVLCKLVPRLRPEDRFRAVEAASTERQQSVVSKACEEVQVLEALQADRPSTTTERERLAQCGSQFQMRVIRLVDEIAVLDFLTVEGKTRQIRHEAGAKSRSQQRARES